MLKLLYLPKRYVSLIAAKFSQLHPQLKVDVQVTSRLIDLVTEGFGLAVRYGKLAESSLKDRKVFELPHVVCVSPAYFERHGIPHTETELKQHNCLVATFNPCIIWRFKMNHQRIDIELEGNWRSNNASALITAAIEGLGICRLPELYLRNALSNGQLVPIFQEYPFDSFPVWLLYPYTRYVPAKVRLFIDYFVDSIGKIARK